MALMSLKVVVVTDISWAKHPDKWQRHNLELQLALCEVPSLLPSTSNNGTRQMRSWWPKNTPAVVSNYKENINFLFSLKIKNKQRESRCEVRVESMDITKVL